MSFAWTKRFQKKQSNDFDWTNHLEIYDSNGIIQNFQYSTNMIFYDENGKKIDTTKSETPEQYLADTYINSNSTVLELGARYGTVSCIINNKLTDRSKQVSVEPDETVWSALESNIVQNNCNLIIHKGFVSEKPKSLMYMGYASRTIDTDTQNNLSLSVEQIQEKYNLKFDTLVADCEGFLETFFDEHPFMYSQLHTVIFEADFPNKCNYDKIRTNLRANGFVELIHGFQNVYKKPWSFLDKAIYINSDLREDRRIIMNDFFKNGQIPLSKVERFPAIMTSENGFIGCAKSHIGCLEMAKEKRWKNVLILEDDLQWENFMTGYSKLEKLVSRQFDALLLTGCYIKTFNEQLKMALYTNAYIVNEHYYDTLISNIKEGLEKKIQAFNEKPVRVFEDIYAHVYNVDVYWAKLQYRDNWLCINPQMCNQVLSYSNISNSYTIVRTIPGASLTNEAIKWLNFLTNE